MGRGDPLFVARGGPSPAEAEQGIHFLISADRLPIQGATFLKSATGRRGLAMRRLDYVYVGTSDSEYDGPLESPRATRAEVLDLLAMVQDCFPDAGLGPDDVLATWAGVRPLIAEEGKSTRDTSREDEVWTGPDGLVTIAGGKLTTYRQMGSRVIDAVRKEIGSPPNDEDRTAEVPLPGAPEGDVETYLESAAARLRDADVEPETIDRMLWIYGTQLDRLVEYGDDDPEWLQPLGPSVPAVRGEVRQAIEEEMASTLVDILDRRLALLLFAPDHGLAAVKSTAEIAADLLGWSAERVATEVAAYKAFAAEHGMPAD